VSPDQEVTSPGRSIASSGRLVAHSHGDALEDAHPAITVSISSDQAGTRSSLGELWDHRELVFFLAMREIKIRYKQSLLGILWVIIQPLLTMVVFSIFFGRLAKMPSDGVPYPLFTLAALVPWMFFSNGITQASNSLVGNANLVTKVYFPRVALPLSAVLSCIVDLAIAVGLLIVASLVYRIFPEPRIVAVIGFAALAFAAAFGIGLWLSAINVRYRDVRHAVPFLVQFWLFATPVAYPSSLIGPRWRAIYALNPMVSVVEGFRWAIVGTSSLTLPMLAASMATTFLFVATGMRYFGRTESNFADII
jgi:lipopolysaccharide transport system permease protein